MTLAEPPPGPAAVPVGAAAAPPVVPPRRRAVRRGALAGIALAAVAVVALLVLTGVLPLLPPSPASNGIAYSRAAELAQAALPPPYAGSAILLVSFGIASTTGGTLSASAFANATTVNCTVTRLGGYPASGLLPIPRFYGAFNSGLSPFWVVVFESSSTGPYVIVAVTDSSAAPVAELSGTGCVPAGYAVNPLPGAVADSPQAAKAAWTPYGAAYAGAGNVTTLTMAAYGGASSGLYTSPPMWVFLYAPCDPFAGGTTPEPAGYVALDLVSLRFLYASSQTLQCPG